MESQITYEVIEDIADLGEPKKGWTKKLRLISWNNKDPKYDLRLWNDKNGRMGKGLTLSEKELILLYGNINEYFTKRYEKRYGV